MANYRLKTQINRGVFKGKKVSELIQSKDGVEYLTAIHNNPKYNVKLSNHIYLELRKGTDSLV